MALRPATPSLDHHRRCPGNPTETNSNLALIDSYTDEWMIWDDLGWFGCFSFDWKREIEIQRTWNDSGVLSARVNTTEWRNTNEKSTQANWIISNSFPSKQKFLHFLLLFLCIYKKREREREIEYFWNNVSKIPSFIVVIVVIIMSM